MGVNAIFGPEVGDTSGKMANIRNQNKELVGAYLFKEDKQVVVKMASNHNVNQSDVVKASLHKFNQLNKKEQSSIISKVID